MTNEQIIQLLPRVEVQVCGIFIERGICEYIEKPRPNSRKEQHNRFANLKFTEKELSNKILVTEEQIKSLRELYPKGTDRKGDVKVIYQKCIKWLTENHKYTFQDIYDVVECYVNEQMYAGAGDMLYSLNNIFYKTDAHKHTKSPMSGLFDKYKKEEDDGEEFSV
jgi:hypothetical protein